MSYQMSVLAWLAIIASNIAAIHTPLLGVFIGFVAVMFAVAAFFSET